MTPGTIEIASLEKNYNPDPRAIVDRIALDIKKQWFIHGPGILLLQHTA
jgi:hypothetical protein